MYFISILHQNNHLNILNIHWNPQNNHIYNLIEFLINFINKQTYYFYIKEKIFFNKYHLHLRNSQYHIIHNALRDENFKHLYNLTLMDMKQNNLDLLIPHRNHILFNCYPNSNYNHIHIIYMNWTILIDSPMVFSNVLFFNIKLLHHHLYQILLYNLVYTKYILY